MGNLRMNADQISYKGGEKPMSVEEAIKNAGNTGLAHTADIAPEFSTESAYNAGVLVYHNGTLYVFTSNHAAGAWSTEDTQAVTVGGELTSLMNGLTNLIKHGTVNVTVASGATTGSAYLTVDTVRIARDRMVGVLIGKNDDVYYNPVILSVHNDGAIEARVIGDAPTTSRTYNVIVSYI